MCPRSRVETGQERLEAQRKGQSYLLLNEWSLPVPSSGKRICCRFWRERALRNKHKLVGRAIFFLPVCQVHRFSVGCCKHTLLRGLMIVCATRSSRCALASTIVRRTSGNTQGSATNVRLAWKTETCLGRKWAACESQAEIPGRSPAP